MINRNEIFLPFSSASNKWSVDWPIENRNGFFSWLSDWIVRLQLSVNRDYGVMVQLYPTMVPTLIHNTQLDQRKVGYDGSIVFKLDKSQKQIRVAP